MTDLKNAEIVTTAVHNKLVEVGDILHIPLNDDDVNLIVKHTLKLIKAQQLVIKRLNELKLIK